MTVAIPAAQRMDLERYGLMALIRELETEAERQYKLARIGGYCHLSSGQEAITVAAAQALREEDLLVTRYRRPGPAPAAAGPAPPGGGGGGRRWGPGCPARAGAARGAGGAGGPCGMPPGVS